MIRRYDRTFNGQISRLFPIYAGSKADNVIPTPYISFQITDACNLQCSYCYEINKGNHHMSLDTAKKFIDLLLENNDQTKQYLDTSQTVGVTLDFIGGEPFLDVELIDNIIQYFIKVVIEKNHPWQYFWRINITSNGTLYNNPKVEQFIKKYKDHLSLTISIDGNKELHDSCRCFPDGTGSYDLAVNMLENIKSFYSEFDVNSKITLSPTNIIYLYDAILNFINLGYKIIYANCIFEKGWTDEHATIFYNELIKIADYLFLNNLEDEIEVFLFDDNYFIPLATTNETNWCGGNGRMMCLEWSGNIYPCLRYAASSLGDKVPPIIIGNVDTGFLSTEEQINNSKQLKQINRLNQSTDECINCPVAAGCAWCQAFNYQDSGVFNHRATYICCMHKARALANVYYWNKYYQKHNIDKKFKMYLPDNEALKIINQEQLNILHELSK